MKVAEKDEAVHGLLEEEYHRCRDALQSLLERMANFPRGTLHVRKKRYKGKEYAYHYMVSREGEKVVNRHVSEKDLALLSDKLKQRDRYKKEIHAYRKRMVYLEHLLKKA